MQHVFDFWKASKDRIKCTKAKYQIGNFLLSYYKYCALNELHGKSNHWYSKDQFDDRPISILSYHYSIPCPKYKNHGEFRYIIIIQTKCKFGHRLNMTQKSSLSLTKIWREDIKNMAKLKKNMCPKSNSKQKVIPILNSIYKWKKTQRD